MPFPQIPSSALRYLKLLKRSFVTYPLSTLHLQYQISGFGHPKIQLCFERWSSEHCCRGGGEKWKGTTRGVAWVIRIHRHEDRHGRFQWRVWHKAFGFAGVPFSPPIGLTPFLPKPDFNIPLAKRRAWSLDQPLPQVGFTMFPIRPSFSSWASWVPGGCTDERFATVVLFSRPRFGSED